LDSRHPDWVRFVLTVQEDLARRDFTVNAMAYNPKQGYIDPFGGQQDLQRGILRTVGNPTERFSEDALRILRGVRFAVRFGLNPHPDTLLAMEQFAPLMEWNLPVSA
jgi:tRNA nucleotidyltransferase (CCA-adding enzyme)